MTLEEKVDSGMFGVGKVSFWIVCLGVRGQRKSEVEGKRRTEDDSYNLV